MARLEIVAGPERAPTCAASAPPYSIDEEGCFNFNTGTQRSQSCCQCGQQPPEYCSPPPYSVNPPPYNPACGEPNTPWISSDDPQDARQRRCSSESDTDSNDSPQSRKSPKKRYHIRRAKKALGWGVWVLLSPVAILITLVQERDSYDDDDEKHNDPMKPWRYKVHLDRSQ